MAASQNEWIDDEQLRTDLDKYVRSNMKRSEVLHFVERDYASYSWSLATLDRRLRYFGISYINYDTPLDEVSGAIQKELDGAGKLLGYRAMNQKLRIKHNIKVPRHLVHNVMADLDPEGLDGRNWKKKAKRKKINFTSYGPLWLVSLDGHDKLCGYQNSTFPFGIYGCMDTFSRKILFLFLSYSNSNPEIVGRKYLEYLYETRVLPCYLRIDKGTETGKMSTIHAYLTEKLGDMEDSTDAIIYGPSTSNKIERWWRDLHERLEKYFKEQLTKLLREGDYDPHDINDRQLLYYAFKPVIENECSSFVENWNTHRIRRQKIELPSGVPDHMFAFPTCYGGKQCGIAIPDDSLTEVAALSGVLEASTDVYDEHLYRKCTQILPSPDKLKPNELMEAYKFLRHHYRRNKEGY